MKKYILSLLLLAGLLSGCSAVDQVSQSVNYVSEVTTYINNTSQLSQQLPELAQQAITDPDARQSLIQELQNAQSQINQFQNLQVPGFAQDLHQQLAGYTDTLGTEVNGLIDQAQAGKLTPEALNNSPIFQTIDQITGLMNQFQQLGNN
ncbi:DUF6376 family protein [Paenibacillus bovis]|uniref:Lipoprotein n=1 Tax=Paenibacillus bovis TaxID=1616788 RepID=A0A172ZCE6_9BACL|nr:DUF6376 family protein [Paenibacillus bovis]ANF95288.1 hypothetical protein AR543_04165 [Paenibacillus bovis]